jgi:hypothetical protein
MSPPEYAWQKIPTTHLDAPIGARRRPVRKKEFEEKSGQWRQPEGSACRAGPEAIVSQLTAT